MVATLTDAPSMTIATSSTNLALNAMPGIQRGGRPRGAHGDAEQDREDERLEIGLTGEVDFDRLQQHRHSRDGDAQNNTRQKSFQMIRQMRRLTYSRKHDLSRKAVAAIAERL